ncbi:MAG: SDR family NAD(P)-dependent oxidoreductase, partial [Alphaproteobacteria bacterium]|nr:SDR family NAD(P)-dependent oxidoreductase [Alphaproteobacteria bacterium]
MNTNAEPGDLSGTAAIVTGSSRNIGRAIALELAKAGAMVVINAKTSADAAEAVAGEITSAGGKAIVHLADVTDADQVERLVGAAVKEFGRLDI